LFTLLRRINLTMCIIPKKSKIYQLFSAHLQALEDNEQFPIWKCAIFSMSKAAQGFTKKRTVSTLRK